MFENYIARPNHDRIRWSNDCEQSVQGTAEGARFGSGGRRRGNPGSTFRRLGPYKHLM